MEPLDDRELGDLLKSWEAPGAPAKLRAPRRGVADVWRWLIGGSIRVPVPAVMAAAVILVLAVWWGLAGRQAAETRRGTVSFAEFQPVKQLEPRVVRSNYEGQ